MKVPHYMRAYLDFLKVRDWDSDYKSVQNLLNHLARKTQSEKSRANYLETLYHLCIFKGCKSPDELITKPSTAKKNKIDRLVQLFIDDMRKKQRSIRYVNVTLEQLKTFYRANGYKKDKEIEVERYHQSARYRKRPEYIPTADEVLRMAYSASTPKWKAIILTLYTTGFRNSTLRAILYSDVSSELQGKKEVIHVPVYPEMKKLVPDACKNQIPYHAFLSKEATEAVKSYLSEYEHINGAKLLNSSPLFPSKGSNDKPMKARTIQDIIKKSARLAGIKQWVDVYPHCIRKSFE
ncbi:MAG: tyrosine-type recombinase/integrase, partial [Nitrososphaerales archaeon]